MKARERYIPPTPVIDPLADFVHGTRFSDIPTSAIDAAKRSLLDSLGVAVMGFPTPQARMLYEEVHSWGGPAAATVLGSRERLPLPAAGLVNGLLCHSLDFDDTHLRSITHPSACIVPAALATAEVAGLDGREVLANAVVGYELVARIGRAASGQFQIRGLHATAVCGAVAVAGMAARALGGSRDGIAHAINCAVSVASGILEPAHDGTWTKLLQAGWAVHGGLVSAGLGCRGYVAPRRGLDGEFGLYAAHVDGEVDYDLLTAGLGREWETEGISIKLYPTCHHIHAFLDAALELCAGRRFGADDIESVILTVGEPQSRVICNPWDAKLHPDSGYAARFSLPYAVAAALVDGAVSVDQYEAARLGDPRIAQVMRTMASEVVPNPDFPKRLGGGVSIALRSGERLTASRANCRGTDASNAITMDDVVAKFMANVGPRLGPDRAEQVVACVQDLERRSVTELIALIRCDVPAGRA